MPYRIVKQGTFYAIVNKTNGKVVRKLTDQSKAMAETDLMNRKEKGEVKQQEQKMKATVDKNMKIQPVGTHKPTAASEEYNTSA